jgi:stage V sporulation protein D (sporulation-specific penicillin-binding protein)
MPDLQNKTISEATAALNDVGLNIKIAGTGTVLRQEYEPGSKVPIGQVVEVEFIQLNNIEQNIH